MRRFGFNTETREATPEAPKPGTPFEGEGYCFREGFFYPMRYDADGNELGPNLDQPLVVKGETLLHAEPTDLSHFGAYGLREIELPVGGEDE